MNEYPRTNLPAWPADKIERRPIVELIPYARNSRVHSIEQVEQIAASIKRWGWTNPVLVDEAGEIIAGHARVLAAKQLGITEAPVMVATGWSDEQKKAYTTADNKLPEGSYWDIPTPRLELAELKASAFDLSLLGFSGAELLALSVPGTAGGSPQDEWQGMPEYKDEDKTAFRSVIVNFADQSAVDEFAQLLGQAINEKTKSIWHPQAEIGVYDDKRYSSVNGNTVFRYGDALPSWFEVPARFAWVLDKDLNKNNPFDRVVIRTDDRVMDCGSAIGTFAAAAIEAGAGQVRCYEPFIPNFEVLTKNMLPYGPRAIVINAALIPDHASKVTLSSDGFPGTHSIVPRQKGKKSIEADAICFRNELLEFQPNVIKLDVEGAEYSLLATLEPGDLSTVSCLFIEFHPHEDRDASVADITRFIRDEGFTIVKDRLRAFTAVRQ